MNHEAISKAASTATYTGSALSVGSSAAQSIIPPGVQETILGLTLNQWTVAGILFGMAMALAGLVVNLIYKRKHFQLAEARLEPPSDGD